MGRNLKINRDFVLFAVGAIVGSTATWLYLKDEYDRRLKEDVDSVKESFGRLYKKEEKPEEEKPYTPTKDDLATLTKTIQTNGYRDYSNSEEEEKESMNELMSFRRTILTSLAITQKLLHIGKTE